MHLHFLGANRQVTGSRYVLEACGRRVMIDCGLVQERQFVSRNWDAPPVDPKSIDWLVLTHAHLDHCGLTPRMVSQGFDGPIIGTEPTAELAEIIMLDSAHIHEEDAAYKKRRHEREGRTGPRPVVPLYTTADATAAVNLLEGARYNEPVKLCDQISVTFHDAGHILGSSIVELVVTEDGTTRRLIFSGDLGQWDKPLIRDPSLLDDADYIIIESTYGDRSHRDAGDVVDQLAAVINETAKRGGNLVIPTFAMERAQELMYHVGRLVHEDRIPDLPVFLNSPMAVDVTEVFRKYPDYLDAETHALFAAGQPPLRFPGLTLVRSIAQSKALNTRGGSNIIMAASGMCTGGRIKHHLKHNIGREDSTILFVGYQANGTLGRLILQGREEIRIFREKHPVRAKIAQIHGFSAHADREDLLHWLANFKQPPKRLFITHGEEDAAIALSQTVESKLKWSTTVPEYTDAVELT